MYIFFSRALISSISLQALVFQNQNDNLQRCSIEFKTFCSTTIIFDYKESFERTEDQQEKINQKRKQWRQNQKKNFFLRPENIKPTSASISTATTSRTTKVEQSQAVKGVNFSDLRNYLINVETVSSLTLLMCALSLKHGFPIKLLQKF